MMKPLARHYSPSTGEYLEEYREDGPEKYDAWLKDHPDARMVYFSMGADPQAVGCES